MKIKRRVIRAISVSVVCILLAATLLFIGVSADTIELVAQYSSSEVLSSDTFDGLIHLNNSDLLYWYGSSIYINSSLGNFSFSYPYSNYNRLHCAVEGSFLYVASCDQDIRLRVTCYDITDISSFSEVYSYDKAISFTAGWGSTSGFGPFIAVENNIVYGFVSYWGAGSGIIYLSPFVLSNGSFNEFSLFEYSFTRNSNSGLIVRSNCLFYDDCFYIPAIGLCYNFVSHSRLSVSDSYTSLISVFLYENNVYSLSSNSIYFLDPNTRMFSPVGGFSGYTTSAYANDGLLTTYGSPSNGSIPYIVYSGLPVSYIQIFSADSSGIDLLDSIPREGLSSLSAFLGSTDNTSALKATYQDGTVLDLTFDQCFDGYAFGDDVPGSQVYPPVRNVWVDIPIDCLTSNLFLLGDYTNGYVTVVDEGWGALVRLNYISPDNYIEFQFFEDSYRITSYSSDGSILYFKYEQESVKRWRLQVDSVWRDWTVYDPELTDYFEIRSMDGVDAVMLDFTYVDSGGGDTSGDESDPETSVPDYSDPLWNGLFSGDPLEESKQNDANSRFNDFNSKAQAEQSLAGDIGGMIPDYSLQVDYAGGIQDQVDKWGSRSDGATSAKDISNWLWSSLGCGAMFSVVMGGVLIRFILQTRA